MIFSCYFYLTDIMTCLCSVLLKRQGKGGVNLSFQRHFSAESHEKGKQRAKVANDIKDVLETLFYNGLQNYSSYENRLIIDDIVKKYNIEPKKIKVI